MCKSFAKADFMKPNSTFEIIQKIVQKYVKNIISVRITETVPKLFRFRSFTNFYHGTILFR